MNTISSIVTFVMVFVIQNTQNRQSDALQIKFDELIRATKGTHNALLDLEELEQGQLTEFRQRYLTLARHAREGLRHGSLDTAIRASPDIRMKYRRATLKGMLVLPIFFS